MNNPFDFSGKVAIVTGAAAGMGLATANAFAEAGAAVVLADYKEDVVKAAAERLVAAGHKAIGVRCDVSDDAQVEAMVAAYGCRIRPARRRVQQRRRHAAPRPDGRQHAR